MLPLVHRKVQAKALLPTVGHPVLQHPVFAWPEIGHDFLVAKGSAREDTERLAKGDEADRKRVGQRAIQIEDHPVESHACSYGVMWGVPGAVRCRNQAHAAHDRTKWPPRYRAPARRVKGNACVHVQQSRWLHASMIERRRPASLSIHNSPHLPKGEIVP